MLRNKIKANTGKVEKLVSTKIQYTPPPQHTQTLTSFEGLACCHAEAA